MSDLFSLEAEIRDDKGKGASRRLRREGKVPAILYGGEREPASITLKHSEVVRQLKEDAFYSHILTIKAAGKTQQVILRDVQRHPFKPTILHMDFMRVMADSEIRVNVPLRFINEDTCVGVKTGGGSVSHTAVDVEVTCLPKDLPEYIEVDLADIDVGDTIHLSGLTMPAGVTLTAFAHGDVEEHDLPVVSVNIIREAPLEEEEDLIEGEEGAEGEEPEGEPED